jgi:hypothetical protein
VGSTRRRVRSSSDSRACCIWSTATGSSLSSLVYGLLAQTGEFTFEPAREVELKGVEGLQRVYPLAATG